MLQTWDLHSANLLGALNSPKNHNFDTMLL